MNSTFQLYLLAREGFDARSYNALFHQQIAALLPKLKNPKQRQHVEGLRGFDFMGYILASLRNAGFKGQDVEEKAHEIAVKLVVTPGKLFAGYDENKHGPLLARGKVAIANAIKNLVAKERRRRDAMLQMTYPMLFLWLPERDQKIVDDFRQFTHDRLGFLGLAILDARLDGDPIKTFVGNMGLGSPSAYVIKTTVRRLKLLAVEFGLATGDTDFLTRVEAAMARRRVN
jgi:hypothetical protein